MDRNGYVTMWYILLRMIRLAQGVLRVLRVSYLDCSGYSGELTEARVSA